MQDVAATSNPSPWGAAEVPATLHIMPMASVFRDAEPEPAPRVPVPDVPVVTAAVTATPVPPPVIAAGTPPAPVREIFSSASPHAGAPVPVVKKVARATRSVPANL